MMKLDIQMFADGGKVVIPIEADTKSFEAQIKETENVLRRLEKKYKEFDEHQGTKRNEVAMAKLREQIEKTTNKLIGLRQKQDDLAKSNLIEIPNTMDKIGNSIGDITKKVVRWGLAVFGIRSAYMAIRQAMSSLSSENEQIATDMEYMRWILAQTLKPVVEWLIKGLYLILTLINMVTKALFRYDFLSGKGAENFKQAKINSSGVAKNLKEANKQQAKFDEMNVLSDTSSSSGAGGGVGGDLGNWEMPNFSSLEKEIENLKNKWYDFGEEMRQSLYDMPFSKWTEAFGNWDLAIYGITETVYGLWEIVTGFFEFLKGIIDIIVGLITGDTELIKQGIVEMLEGLWKFIDGTIKTILGLIHTSIGVVVGLFRTAWDIIVGILKVVGSWVYNNVIKPVGDFFSGLWNGIVDGASNGIKKIKDFFGTLPDFFRGLIKKINSLLETIGKAVGDIISGAFKGVVNGILWAIENILNNPIKAVNKLIDVINKVPGISLGKLSIFKLPRLAQGGIINMPGRGVPVGTAIGGEHGAEGVIPLTDSQQMALLGEAIGKYININATIPVYVGNRQIARELRKINAEDEFARNS